MNNSPIYADLNCSHFCFVYLNIHCYIFYFCSLVAIVRLLACFIELFVDLFVFLFFYLVFILYCNDHNWCKTINYYHIIIISYVSVYFT